MFVIRNLYDTPRYKDEEEDRRQLEARQKEVQDDRLFRERVEKWREEDRQERNRLKIQQIEECERLQVCKLCHSIIRCAYMPMGVPYYQTFLCFRRSGVF